MSESSPRTLSSLDAYVQSEAKRRRLRKGTHSCWECKRRKMKCVFDTTTTTTICKGCQRRGSQCVSQEFSEDASFPNNNTPTTPPSLEAAEARYTGPDRTLFDRPRLRTSPSEDGRRANYSSGIPTPVSVTADPYSQHVASHTSIEHHTVGRNIPQSTAHTPAVYGEYERLSRALHAALPSREDTERICTAGRHPSVLSYEIMTIPYTTLHETGLKTAESLLEIPESNLPPVLIARHMLLLASFLQHLLHKEMNGLSESPRAMMERLADLAISLVTTNDQLIGSIEGLECVMIESVYQANIGNLRRSWLACRRAVNIAQLMGIHRSDHQARYQVLDPKTRHHPQLMWFRIVFLDRYLCLMLGLSQGSLDCSMASDFLLANDTPMGRLERIHCVIASRILERNEAKPSCHDLTLTRDLDVELQKAARSLPSKWWLAPALDLAETDSQALFWSTRRLFAQVLHYNLLNQLHLPYMLRPSSTERKYEYSLIACVNASREVLSRFITLRSFNGNAYSCRTVDFLAHMAAMTLLLAHLDSHLSETENLLAHQYHSDRAMIENVQENMKEVNRLNSDTLSAQSADLLGRLLAIEIETADGHPYCASRIIVQEEGTGTALVDQDDDAVVSVHIPYFGIIKIAREGISKEVPKPQVLTATTNRSAHAQISDRPSINRTETSPTNLPMSSSRLTGSSGARNVEAIIPSEAVYGHLEAPPTTTSDTYAKSQRQLEIFQIPATSTDQVATHSALPFQDGSSDTFLEYGGQPGLTAGGEDWAFQGADLAFFESLMRGNENIGDNSAEWIQAA